MTSTLTRLLIPLFLLTALAACTPPKEKIVKMLNGHLDSCKSADGDFAQIQLFGKKTQEVLKSTCSQPIEDLRLEDKIKAIGMVGPYKWIIGQNPSSGVWVVSDIEWREMADARRVLAEDDRDETTLASGIKHLEAVEKKLPDDPWVKRSRMELMLELRQKMRSKKGTSEQDITGLGADTQAYYDATLTWAREKSNKDIEAHARSMVMDYYDRYNTFIEDSFANQGSGDESLENAIKLEEKEGRPEKAEEYRKELEKVRAERIVQTEVLTKRQALIKAALCKEAALLSADGVKDEALKGRVVAAKQAAQATCAP